jgi:sugar lactone lactonase YvrE
MDGFEIHDPRFRALVLSNAPLETLATANRWLEGPVWFAGPQGELLGKILTVSLVSNLCFGGRNRSRLFICASHTLMAIYTNTRGCVRP